MKLIKRLFLRFVWLPVIVYASGCAAAKSARDMTLMPTVNHVDTRMDEAIRYTWQDCFGESGAPRVRFASGAALTCVDPVSGRPGFPCPTVGCREGCTFVDSVVSIHDGDIPSSTTLVHELKHQHDTLHGIFNPEHTGDFNLIVNGCKARLIELGL